MSLRNGWEFEYGIEELADAARVMAAYHTSRLDWWRQEADTTVSKIKEKGIEVREYEVTGGKDAQVVIDPELARRLSECKTKIGKHERKDEEYTSWAEVLATEQERGARTMTLDHEDVLFFGLVERDGA